jgi:selenocysteine lyase/cysteine desulfurase
MWGDFMDLLTTNKLGYDVETLRATEFLLAKSVTYLNHGGVSPLPSRTTAAVQDCIHRMGANAIKYFHDSVMPLFSQFLEDCATFVNAPDMNDLCCVTSTSSALGLVAGAIDWQAGDEVIFCDVEFPANAYPWLSLEKIGVNCRVVPAQNGTLTVEAVEAVVNERTRLITVSAVQFFTGSRADLQALGQYCKDHGIIFVVDAIQAIGHIPIDVQSMNIDVLATGGQKSLLALTGVGFLYVRRELCDQLIPYTLSANSVEGWEHWLNYDLTPRAGAARFMTGTPNIPGMVSIVSSLSLINELERVHIDKHTTALTGQFWDRLDAEGYQIVTPRNDNLRGPIITFQYHSSIEVTQHAIETLDQNDIMVGMHLNANGEPYVRLSVHCYNNDDDVQRFFYQLHQLETEPPQ